MIDIEELRKLNQVGKIAITEHARIRLFERKISVTGFKDQKGAKKMRCSECGAVAEKGFTTSVTDLENCLVIVRNVPCYKCTECNEIIYTADVVQCLEKIIDSSKKLIQEISVVDYSKVA